MGSDKTIYVCTVEGCHFRVYASWNQDTIKYILKSLRPKHNCVRATNNKEVRSGWRTKRHLESLEMILTSSSKY